MRILAATLIAGTIIFIGGCTGAAEPNSVSSGSGNSNQNGAQVPIPTPTPDPVPDPLVITPNEPTPDIAQEQTYFYFSYDDSASTAARDLSFTEINADRKPPSTWGRPYEFLNAENFDHFNVKIAEPFAVSIGLYKAKDTELPVTAIQEKDIYALGVNISGPTLNLSERKNIVLTLLVDVSGSMAKIFNGMSRLSVTQFGLHKLKESLKPGDMINLVTFDSIAYVQMTNWAFNIDDSQFETRIDQLTPRFSTNIDNGIAAAYDVANKTYDPNKYNRIILLTDAEANEGQADPSIIADHLTIGGAEGIHFAGVGIGEGFNDEFLNELTDIGKSVYSAMITPADAERIFTEGFMRFVDTAVTDVKFRLDYPQSFDQLQSAAEQISTEESKVDTINFAYNSEQFFLELFTKDEISAEDERFILTITYNNESGETQTIKIEKTVEEILNYGTDEIKSAIAVTSLANLIGNRVNCETVKSSDLFSQDIPTWTFTTYIDAINKFCK